MKKWFPSYSQRPKWQLFKSIHAISLWIKNKEEHIMWLQGHNLACISPSHLACLPFYSLLPFTWCFNLKTQLIFFSYPLEFSHCSTTPAISNVREDVFPKPYSHFKASWWCSFCETVPKSSPSQPSLFFAYSSIYVVSILFLGTSHTVPCTVNYVSCMCPSSLKIL